MGPVHRTQPSRRAHHGRSPQNRLPNLHTKQSPEEIPKKIPIKIHQTHPSSQSHPPPPTISPVNTSLFELFKIGIGPSSSHTVGPMRAALRFTRELTQKNLLDKTARVNVDLYGSLALTGIGHGTDRAVLLGLLGEAPDTVDPATVETKITAIRNTNTIALGGRKTIPFTEAEDLNFRRNQMYPTQPSLPPQRHALHRLRQSDAILAEEVFYSIGGGFIVSETERTAESLTSSRTSPIPSAAPKTSSPPRSSTTSPSPNSYWPTRSPSSTTPTPHQPPTTPPLDPNQSPEAQDPHQHPRHLANHAAVHRTRYRHRRHPPRRPQRPSSRSPARRATQTIGSKDPLAPIDWVTVYAMAVNEENAAGAASSPPHQRSRRRHPRHRQLLHPFHRRNAEEKRRHHPLLPHCRRIGILYKEKPDLRSRSRLSGRSRRSLHAWPPEVSSPPSTEPTRKSNMQPRSPWNTTSA